jgi:LuxR family maltose regulon positive regulatory protein
MFDAERIGNGALPSSSTTTNIPLLATKLYIPPVRAEQVARPHLIRQLSEGLNRKLTLISAPAGFGKTTLLSQWIHRVSDSKGRRFGSASVGQSADPNTQYPEFSWLSLDKGDNDPNIFWTYVLAALRTIPSLFDADVGGTLLTAIQSTGLATGGASAPLERILTLLINQIAALREDEHPDRRYVLILDDYHTIVEKTIHEGLTFLLDHLPPQLHLVIASRVDPPLPLSRLRSRHQLNELNETDLRFTPEEARTFLEQVMGLELPQEHIASLEARTEGWIVGLQMAALSMQRVNRTHAADFVSAFTGSHRFVLDYLTEEVLLHQSQDTQTFLMRTAILDRLCGPLCDAVTGQGNGQLMLERLDRANLFIVPLDDQRYWYRYHHLFADLLRERLARTSPDLVPGLHNKASVWFEQEGLITETMSHVLAMADYERAADLVEKHAPKMAQRGEFTILESWLKALPEDLVRTRPILCLGSAWITLPHSLELADEWTQSAMEAFALMAPDADKLDADYRADLDLLTAEVLDIQATIAQHRGDPPEKVMDLTLQVLERVPENEASLRASPLMRLGWCYMNSGDEAAADRAFLQSKQLAEASGHHSLALQAVWPRVEIARRQGRMRDAAAICRDALKEIVQPLEQLRQVVPPCGLIYIALGRILLERNQLEEAEHDLTHGLELSEAFVPQHGARLEAHIALAYLWLAQGNLDKLPDLNVLAQQNWPQFSGYLAAHQARVWQRLAEHDPQYLGKAVRWVKGCELKLEADTWSIFSSLVVARVRIAQHRTTRPGKQKPDLSSVIAFLGRLEQLVQERGWNEPLLETLIVTAMTHHALGRDDLALAALERALTLAEPEGYVRIFLDEGLPMARLLYQAAQRGLIPEYTGRLLAAFDALPMERVDMTVGFPTTKVRDTLSIVEPLTPREIEVLQLIAEGLSNREIAQRLSISLSTVKRHNANIYGKLAVNNRTRAVAQARDWGLLQPEKPS